MKHTAAGAALLVVGVAVTAATMVSAPANLAQEAAADTTSFTEDVAPILTASCVQCHGGEVDGVIVKEVSLDLTTYEGVMAGSEFGTVVEAGNPNDSYLFVMVQEGDMPFESDPLPPEQIEILRRWIAGGALNN